MVKIGKSPGIQRLKRAQREVEIQRAIHSHYYPETFDFQIFPNFQFVIIEEFVESQPLSACRGNFRNPTSIVEILISLANGLNLLWEKGVIHRDIKPDNILIKKDLSPVIIDLGIVLALEGTSLTSPFALRGPCTPSYASPEQLKNRRAQLDHRTDQFILGIDIMELIGNGVHPFDPVCVRCGNSTPENIIEGRWDKGPLEVKSFSFMKPLISKMLAPEPYLRFRTPDLFIRELQNCLEACK